MSDKHDRMHQAFMRQFAKDLGVEEVTSEALAKSLGLDELTEEYLEAWFIREVLGIKVDKPTEPPARVVQVDRDERRAPPTKRLALPPARRKRPGSRGDW